ncbi:hypothetical protein D3C73_1309670 [compost metagenome]
MNTVRLDARLKEVEAEAQPLHAAAEVRAAKLLADAKLEPLAHMAVAHRAARQPKALQGA